jgi:hypothetical protein
MHPAGAAPTPERSDPASAAVPTRPRPAPGVAARLVADELVLVRLREGEMIVLNPAGALLWSLLDGSRSAAALAAEVGRRAGEAVAAGVADHLAELAGLGLLVEEGTAAEAAPPVPAPRPEAVQAPPAVVAAEVLETLASGCDSGQNGQADCMVYPTCTNAWW